MISDIHYTRLSRSTSKVIVHSWRDSKLKAIRWWLHLVPVAIGAGLAYGGLPFYQNTIVICHIQNPPVFEETWYPSVFFVFVPVFSALFLTTAMMIRVYFKVRQQTQRAARWQFANTLSFRRRQSEGGGEGRHWFFSTSSSSPVRGADNSDETERSSTEISRRCARHQSATATSRLEVQVFVQSTLFLSAFYISWSFLVAAYIVGSPAVSKVDGTNLFPLYLTCFILAPLQGFWNCCVYFRPRLMSRRRARERDRNDGATQRTTATTAQPGPFTLRAFFGRHSSSNASTSDSAVLSDETGSSDDPSTAIAKWKSQSASNPDVAVNGDTLKADLFAIKEELEQLEDAEFQIEEYPGDSS